MSMHIITIPPLAPDKVLKPSPASSVPLVHPGNPVGVLSPTRKVHGLALNVLDSPPGKCIAPEEALPDTSVSANRNVLARKNYSFPSGPSQR